MWRRKQPRFADLIRATTTVINELGLHPLTLELGRDGARMTVTMDETALETRSRGPYSPDELPPEIHSTFERLALAWRRNPEIPQFAVDIGAAWPVLDMTLPQSRVQVRFVVPEDAPPVFQPDPGLILAGPLTMALGYLADALDALNHRSGPPLAVTLSYPDDPQYAEQAAGLTGDALDFLTPVLAVLEIDGSRLSTKERAALGDAVRRVLTDRGWNNVEPLGPHGFVLRFGWVRLRFDA